LPEGFNRIYKERGGNMSHTLLFVVLGALFILLPLTTKHEREIKTLQEAMRIAKPDTIYVITSVPIAVPDTLNKITPPDSLTCP
jgi:hypothetical protein